MPLLSPAQPDLRYTVLVADSYDPEGLRILEEGGPFDVVYEPSISAADLLRRAAEFHIIIVRSRTTITAEVIAAAPNLRIVGRAGVGLDNVDIDAATRHGVMVMNAPGGNTVSTAEHSFAMLMALARRIPAADASMRAGRWEKKKFDGVELDGKKLGIVGFGRIGRTVARRARAFGMRIVVHDPFVTQELLAEFDARAVDVATLMADSDMISVHAPLTDKTRGLIGAAELAAARPGLLLVNCARGGIVDEAALVAALRARGLAGAALEVFEEEPLAADHPLRSLDNVVLTPHLAASTGEATRQVAIEMGRQVVEAFRTGAITNAANAPNLSPATLERVRPYLEMARRAGVFAHHLLPGRPSAIRVTGAGRIAELDSMATVTSSFLIGLLQPMFERRINLINVRATLRELGIDLVEARHDEPVAYSNMLEVEVTPAAGAGGAGEGASAAPVAPLTLKATLFEPDLPRLVEINGKRVDAVPEGQLMVLENQDVPGIVGAVTTVLGRHKNNIGQMTWGRRAPGSDAMTVINLDDDVPAEAVEEIRALPGISSIRVFKI
jgi:D-3-phosphoglycerate dehydrogenase